MKRLLTVFAALFVLSSCAGSPRQARDSGAPADLEEYRRLVAALAADDMEGRGVLTDGNEKATAFLEKAFEISGLAPGGDDGRYRQCFDHPVSVRADRVELAFEEAALAAAELAPTAFSSSADFEGELVFAGYGIHAPDAGYTDYEGWDPKDKVLLVMRFEPRERDPESPLNGDRPSRHSEMRRKVFEAKSRGAKAILFVAPPDEKGDLDRKVPGLEGAEAQSEAGLPVLHVHPDRVEKWLAAAETSLAAAKTAIDETMTSSPTVLGRVRGAVELTREKRTLCNVIGVLPGRGALASEAVVVGAHFDHLGFGQQGSMAPGEKAIHNGADDNASGAAALPILARRIAPALPKSHRSLVFVAFNGEEVGLAGSSTYVDRPTVALDQTNAMLNMDMIGRMRDGKLVVLGTQSGDRLEAWVKSAAEAASLELETHGDGYGPSDQTPFYSRGVPVLHFFTGAHEHYHRPSDDTETLNLEGAESVVRVVREVALRAATHETRVAYQETSSGPALAGDSRGYGAWLGTVPDYTAMSPGAEGGVLLSGVSKGGPAEEAGITGGDRLVAMAGRDVDNLYDMTFVLRDHHPGDVITVAVEREGKRIELAATLGDRSTRSKSGGHGTSPHGSGDSPHGSGESPHGGGSPHGYGSAPEGPEMDPKTLLYPGEEKHLKNLRQLTFEGENAEAYFSPDGKRLVYQARGGEVACDRIYVIDIETKKVEQISSGEGRTTCGYYTWPDGKDIIYASTHLGSKECPPEPDHSRGYVWALYPSYDLFLKTAAGNVQRLTSEPGYDAEATVCFRDGRVVFTSTRDGDLDLYVMHPKMPRAGVKRLTTLPGYDGGAFFSPDCSKLVWRASRPEGKKLEEYRALLAQDMVRPSEMEIFVADSDGKNARQVTKNGRANFAPYFLPDNRRILFSSNLGDERGRNFDIYLIDPYAEDPAKTQERITYSPVFEAFPMFSPDGKYLVFASNRNAKKSGDTNLFIAEWVD